MDVWEYFQTRDRELRECSLYRHDDAALYHAERDDQRGKILGLVYFNGYPETVCLAISEDVSVKGSGITRRRYAYYLVIDTNEIGGYERDPSHNPAVHKHCSGRKKHERSPSRVVSFKEAAEEAWRYVSEFAAPIQRPQLVC